MSTILIPEVVFWLMTAAVLGDGVMLAAVTTFWAPLRGILPWLDAEPITEEAFCTARKALSLSFFRRLFGWLVRRFDEAHGERFRWNGLRLLGIDGSMLTLPKSKALRRRFPGAENQHGQSKAPMARLVALVGLWDAVCRAMVVVPQGVSENWCARYLSRFLGPQDLVLFDRNFPSTSLFVRIAARGAHFLMRLPSNRFHVQERCATPSERRDEHYVTVRVSRTDPQRLRGGLPKTIKVRILEYQISGFRPARLITSLLDTQLYPYDDIVALYHERWRQETQYREWKHTLELNNLRSKSKEGIVKEIFVQLTLANSIRWIMADATTGDTRPIDLSFIAAKRLITAAILAMAVAPTERLPVLYRGLLDTIRRHRILVRPDRNYPRRHDETPRNKGKGRFAQPARETLKPSTKARRAASKTKGCRPAASGQNQRSARSARSHGRTANTISSGGDTVVV